MRGKELVMGGVLCPGEDGNGENGWCRAVPSGLADMLWGLENPPSADSKAGYELRRAGVRICEMCPLRHRCLAVSVVNEAQDGIHGGLPLKARRQLKRRAEAKGIDFDSRSSGIAVAQVQHWLDTCPEEIAGARAQENELRRKRYIRRVSVSKPGSATKFSSAASI